MPTTPMYRITQVATGVTGSPYYMTGYFAADGGTPQASAQAWQSFLNPGTTTLGTPLNYSAITEVDLVDPVTGNVTSRAAVNVGSVQFTNTIDKLPPANQFLVRFRTGVYVAGREIRGRINLPGYTESESDAGRPTSSLLSAYQTKIATLLGDVNTQHCVYSKKYGQWAESVGGSGWVEWAILRSRRD